MAKIEITAHRLGGQDDYPRTFGPAVYPFSPSTVELLELTAWSRPNVFVQVELSTWTDPLHEWRGCTAQLHDGAGAPLGQRPVMMFDKPYDIPTHTNFGARHPDAGTFILSIRRTE